MSRGKELGYNHYSNKGAHKLRGIEQSTRQAFTEMFPGQPYFPAQQQQMAIEQHIARRSMRRIPRDGRGR